MNLVERAAKQLEFDGHYELAKELREHMNNPLDSIFEQIRKNQQKAWIKFEQDLLDQYALAIQELEQGKQNG